MTEEDRQRGYDEIQERIGAAKQNIQEFEDAFQQRVEVKPEPKTEEEHEKEVEALLQPLADLYCVTTTTAEFIGALLGYSVDFSKIDLEDIRAQQRQIIEKVREEADREESGGGF